MTALACDSDAVALRRRQILEAAKSCFRIEGFHAASMAQIAASAELSVGQIYRYFENKEAIVTAIVQDNLDETRRDFARITGEGGDFVLSMAEHIRLAVDRLADQDCASLMFEVKAEAARNAKLGAFLRSADEDCRAHMRDVIRVSVPSCVCDLEVDTRVEMICVLFEGLLMRKLKRPDIGQEALGPLIEAVVTTLLGSKAQGRIISGAKPASTFA